MPSANKTPLGLNQWQANEYPKMADFNEDNRIIDEKITELQSGSGVKIYTVEELTDPVENKIYNVKIEENTSTINEKPVYKEGTSESVTLKAGKVATVYFSGGNFFYKASASGNAVAENVLADKKFSNDDGTDITGTMENHGAKIFTPTTANIIIPKGYYDGTGYIEGDSDLVASNIVQGKQIFGVDGQALQYQQYEKTAIANALTSKGIPTSTTTSWGQIERNIRNIKTYKTIPISGAERRFINKDHRTNPHYNRYPPGVSGNKYMSLRVDTGYDNYETIMTHLLYGERIRYNEFKKIIIGCEIYNSIGRFYLVPESDILKNTPEEFVQSIKSSDRKIEANTLNTAATHIDVPNNENTYKLVFLSLRTIWSGSLESLRLFTFNYPFFILES